jgi:hypothetical protein
LNYAYLSSSSPFVLEARLRHDLPAARSGEDDGRVFGSMVQNFKLSHYPRPTLARARVTPRRVMPNEVSGSGILRACRRPSP